MKEKKSFEEIREKIREEILQDYTYAEEVERDRELIESEVQEKAIKEYGFANYEIMKVKVKENQKRTDFTEDNKWFEVIV